MSKTCVFTDVHGRLEELLRLLDKVPKGAKLIFLGDSCVELGSYDEFFAERLRHQTGNHIGHAASRMGYNQPDWPIWPILSGCQMTSNSHTYSQYGSGST